MFRCFSDTSGVFHRVTSRAIAKARGVHNDSMSGRSNRFTRLGDTACQSLDILWKFKENHDFLYWYPMVFDQKMSHKSMKINGKSWNIMIFYENFHKMTQLWQAVAPSSGGLFELPDMFFISTPRDLAIPRVLFYWESPDESEKHRNIQNFFQNFQDFQDPEDGPPYLYRVR